MSLHILLQNLPSQSRQRCRSAWITMSGLLLVMSVQAQAGHGMFCNAQDHEEASIYLPISMGASTDDPPRIREVRLFVPAVVHAELLAASPMQQRYDSAGQSLEIGGAATDPVSGGTWRYLLRATGSTGTLVLDGKTFAIQCHWDELG